MVVASTVPVQITEEAERFVLEMGLQQALLRMLDEIPKRFPGVHSIAVSMDYIVDEGGRPVVTLGVTRELLAIRPDPSNRQWQRWEVETFPPDILQYFVTQSLFTDDHAR